MLNLTAAQAHQGTLPFQGQAGLGERAGAPREEQAGQQEEGWLPWGPRSAVASLTDLEQAVGTGLGLSLTH